MTSISAISASTHQSPLQRLQDELQSEVNAGTIGSSDQTALSSALSDIDSALQESRKSDQASGTRQAPGDLKSKIDDLIANEVSAGKLTTDQATELQGVFKAAFAHGRGGAGGAGGPPPGPPPSGDGSDGADSTNGSSTSNSADTILKDFLKLLQDSLSASSSSSYGATGDSGSSGNGASGSALLFDYKS